MEFWEKEYEKALKGEKTEISKKWLKHAQKIEKQKNNFTEYTEACWDEVEPIKNNKKNKKIKKHREEDFLSLILKVALYGMVGLLVFGFAICFLRVCVDYYFAFIDFSR